MSLNPRNQIQNGLDTIINGVHKSAARYINEFMSLKSAPDMLSLELFPNAKEITESMAAYNAIHRVLKLDLTNPNTAAVVVGDGSTPRTAAVIAFRSAWAVLSIDPQMAGRRRPDVRRLEVMGARIEDCPDIESKGDVVIVAVHSHAPLDACLAKIRAAPGHQRHVVAMPCCIDLSIPGVPPETVYQDLAVWSPKREVRTWRNV